MTISSVSFKARETSTTNFLCCCWNSEDLENKVSQSGKLEQDKGKWKLKPGD